MRIAYVTPYSLLDGSTPFAQRISGVTLSLQHAGHSVVVAGGHASAAAASGYAASVHVRGTGEISTARSRPMRAAHTLAWGGSTARWLDSGQRPDAVVVYGGSAAFIGHLLHWSRRHSVPLVTDSVEWYEPSHLPGGRLGPFSIANELAMRSLYPRSRNVIAISTFLREHYETKGCHVVVVPPTRDVLRDAARTSGTKSGAPLRLAYAGVPGRKDLIDTVIRAIPEVREQTSRDIRLDLAGPTPDELLQLPALAGARSLPGWLTAHGRLTGPGAQSLVRNADLLPLLRPSARYAQAGFPTKVVEALSLGTPVIGNLTSDLSSYLVEGETAFVAASASLPDFAAALRRAACASHEQHHHMRTRARATAEAHFDFRTHAGRLDEFFANLRRSP